mgnify:CR=1 FL=1
MANGPTDNGDDGSPAAERLRACPSRSSSATSARTPPSSPLKKSSGALPRPDTPALRRRILVESRFNCGPTSLIRRARVGIAHGALLQRTARGPRCAARAGPRNAISKTRSVPRPFRPLETSPLATPDPRRDDLTRYATTTNETPERNDSTETELLPLLARARDNAGPRHFSRRLPRGASASASSPRAPRGDSAAAVPAPHPPPGGSPRNVRFSRSDAKCAWLTVPQPSRLRWGS